MARHQAVAEDVQDLEEGDPRRKRILSSLQARRRAGDLRRHGEDKGGLDNPGSREVTANSQDAVAPPENDGFR